MGKNVTMQDSTKPLKINVVVEKTRPGKLGTLLWRAKVLTITGIAYILRMPVDMDVRDGDKG